MSDWRRVEEIVHAALERSPGERVAFVRDACGSDDNLRAEVESLLANASVADKSALRMGNVGLNLVGQQIGIYRVDALVGAGGMGEVYRARDTKLGREVAIKVLPAAFTSDAERVSRFQREARALASLNHPHIGAIYGFEEIDGIAFLVLELVDGPSLAERIATRPFTIPEVLDVARQLSEALDAAHEKGVVHRDLKPANIKLTSNGQVKVLDFGLAKLSAPEGADSAVTQSQPTMATREGAIFGTPAYMSPEQARGRALDKRTDIWAFGCVLYEMLTCRAAFRGETLTDTLAAVVERGPDWSRLPAGTPSGVRRLLSRCLEKDPKRRLRDIADARIEFDEAIERPAEPPRSDPAAGSSFARTRLVRYALVGALAAGLAGVTTAVVIWRNDTPPITVFTSSVLPGKGTTFPSTGPWPVISPDGRHIAFVAVATGGEQRLWVRQLDSSASRPLPGTEGAVRPFWAPDSRSIGFFANGRLSRVDIDTGTARVIADVPYSGGLSGSWGDGVIVFRSAGSLNRISPAGGEPSVVFRDPDGTEALTPSFLPDGRRFLYLLQSDRGRSQLCVALLDSEERRCFENIETSAVYAPPGYLLFLAGVTLVAQPFDLGRLVTTGTARGIPDARISPTARYNPPLFSASRTGILAFHTGVLGNQLVWHDRNGLRLGAPLGAGGRPALSPDGTLLVSPRRDELRETSDLWLYDLGSGTDSRFTFDAGDEAWPAFSPDGQVVLYSAGPTGRLRIFQKRVRGDSPEQALVPDVFGASLQMSPDGRFVLFQRPGVQNSFDLFAQQVGVAEPPVSIAETPHGERDGRFSPDGRWVAYDSTETGRREVWVQPFPPTGARWQISRTGGVSPQWRADGKELFYVAGDGRLMAAPIVADRAVKAGVPQALFQTIYHGGVYANYAASPDGQRFVVPVPPALEDEEPISVVVNWTATLAE